MPGDRARTVANDGVRLHVREWPGGGDDVLLIHGLASSSHIWDLVAPRLVRLGLHPVAYDQRGHGRSSKPSSGYGFDETTADAAAVIRATRLHRPIVVGHSWGANVALELAVRRSRSVGGTVLLDGGFVTMRDRFDWATAKRMLAPPEFGGITVDAFLRRIHRNLVAHDPRHTRARRGLPVARPRGSEGADPATSVAGEPPQDPPRTVGTGHARAARTRPRANAGPGRAFSLGRVGRTGFERDKAIAARRVRTIGPPVSFEWIEGIHDVPLQRPEAVARRIAKLAEAAARVRRRRS